MKNVNNDNINISKKKILYISPEYGYDQNINNYAGGLGILAGDFLKEASDQSLPIIAVGLYYREGYFVQSFDDEFNQIATNNPLNLNYKEFQYLKENDKFKVFEIQTNIGIMKFRVLKTKINEIDLYLIDSRIDNKSEFKDVTRMLYTPSRRERLLQEILLGQGAIILLDYLKIEIDKLHINEGHAAFALLERINKLTDKNNNFDESFKIIKETNLFTTHTPIIHGNEEFETSLIKEILDKSSLLRYITIDNFIKLGRIKRGQNFSMTVLSLRLSEKYNSVSMLHNKVATKMWKVLDKNIKFENITNGIYIYNWISYEFAKYISGNKIYYDPEITKNELKERTILELNANNFFNRSESLLKLYSNTRIPDDAFIIGFARRFAPYKRADLLFTDIERLKRFFKNNPKVVILISGKAHPADVDGKLIIKEILAKIKDNNLQKNIIFIENYSITKAKKILWASDIWLNNPIRGLEACGTSGMKAALNGTINFSILDGWWDEEYHNSIGFKIGGKSINKLPNQEIAYLILDKLENEILKLYEDKNKWNKMMTYSLHTILHKYSTKRMLEDYKEILYK